MKFDVKTQLITDYIKSNNLSITKFCKKAKITSSTLKDVLNKQSLPLVPIYKIARVMDVSLSELIL